MHTLVLHAKLALYARQSYLGEMTRGIAVVLLADVVVSIMLKRIERSRRRLAKELAANTNNALQQVRNVIQ